MLLHTLGIVIYSVILSKSPNWYQLLLILIIKLLQDFFSLFFLNNIFNTLLKNDNLEMSYET